MRLALWILPILALPSVRTAAAQHQDHASAYADFTDRDIKALSQEDIDGLLAGAGMGMALPAELNGYPGPKHVLELADELALTPGQKAEVERVFSDMSEQAKALGARIVELERELDTAFASGTVTPEELDRRLNDIASLRGRLRSTHLKAHLEVTPLLTDDQRMRYRHARGYGMDHR